MGRLRLPSIFKCYFPNSLVKVLRNLGDVVNVICSDYLQ